MKSYQNRIKEEQSKFRILKDWKISYEPNVEYKGQSTNVAETKLGTIYEFDPKPGEQEPDDYIFHEILHACMRELKVGDYHELREKEELFVQDLCQIIFPDKETDCCDKSDYDGSKQFDICGNCGNMKSS